jgi:hypothetical protein
MLDSHNPKSMTKAHIVRQLTAHYSHRHVRLLRGA